MSNSTPVPMPDWRLSVDAGDITRMVSDRLVELTLQDRRGMEADTLSLVLDDADGLLNIPNRGAKIEFHLGWQGEPLRNMGKYTVDDIAHEGPPDRLRITARAANFRDEFKVAKETDWDDYTLQDIIDFIAGDHNLAPAVSPALGAIHVQHLDQTNESDAHFLSRLAKRYDAIASVKHEKLLFIHKGRGLSAGGAALPTLVIDRTEQDQHHYEETDRESRYTGVKALWSNPASGRREFVVVGADGYLRTLKDPYPTEAEATDAANGEWGRIQRAKALMSITLAKGRADLQTEYPVRLTGWKPHITAHAWVLAQATHKLTPSTGYTTSLELEVKKADG